MKDYVLINIKKEIENGEFFIEIPEKKKKKGQNLTLKI